uniref:Putative secreted protein n=1 Tax=Rhipicephalus microplus TaxID=6941 RepID=A0A6G5A094_RHIMP
MKNLEPIGLITLTCVFLNCFYQAMAIKCYQCSTSEDPKGEDRCGAYAYYDKTKNTAVECLGEEAKALGTFCYKRIMQGPRGFIWDGRWRSVERRCAQISERGVNWGCDWGYHGKWCLLGGVLLC